MTMITKTIFGAMLALISLAVLPNLLSKPSDQKNIADEVSAVQLELAQIVEQLSQDEKILALSDSLQGLHHQQSELQMEMRTSLDEIAAQLRKINATNSSSGSKYITKMDLDEAIATAKDTVEQAKAAAPFGCDCDCQSKLASLEARIAALEAKCNEKPATSGYSTKSSGSTGSLTQSSFTVHSTPTYTVGGSGSTGSVVTSYYSQPAPVAIDLPDQTRTVRVVEPRVRRQVTYAEVPSSSDVNLSVQSPPSQCYIDANGNQVCPQTAPAVSAQRWTLGSRLRGGR
jgi:hypothetical protein